MSISTGRASQDVPYNLDEGTGKDLSGGAMELLTDVSKAQVVATYTDLPLLSLRGSLLGLLCRISNTMPTLDMKAIIPTVPELHINIPSNPSRRFRKKLGTLKLRFGLKIRQLGMSSVFHARKAFPETEAFLAAFQSAAALLVDGGL